MGSGRETASKPSKSQQSTSLHLQQLQAIGAERRARLFTHRSSKKGAGRRGDESPYSPLHDSKRNIVTQSTTKKQQQLDDFLDLNLGTQAERDYQRYVSKWISSYASFSSRH